MGGPLLAVPSHAVTRQRRSLRERALSQSVSFRTRVRPFCVDRGLGNCGISFAVRRRSRLVLHAAFGTPALPLPLAVHAPATEASRKVFQVPVPQEGPRAMISTAAVRLLNEYTGRGPTKAKTLLNDDVVTILLADTLTKGERKLVDSGRSDRVLQLRHDYQLTMRKDLIAIVERQLDCKVIAFMSQNHIDPDLAVEVFVLESGGAA